MSAAGRTSFPVNPEISHDVYKLCGFRVLGEKAVRIDILERLADFIRPALSWKPQSDAVAPDGAVDGRSFIVTPAMLSILGATHQDMELVLKGLGYRGEVLPEADVLARLPRRETATPQPATDPATEVVIQEAPLEAETAPAAAPDEDAPKEGDATPELKTLTIWRSGRTGNQRERRDGQGAGERGRNQRNRNGDGNAREALAKDGEQASNRGQRHKQGGKQRHEKRPENSTANAKPQRAARPERPLDPDSPFAKLAQLKASLEGRND